MIEQHQIKYQKLLKSYNLLNQYNIKHIIKIQEQQCYINELENKIKQLENDKFINTISEYDILKKIYDLTILYKKSLDMM